MARKYSENQIVILNQNTYLLIFFFLRIFKSSYGAISSDNEGSTAQLQKGKFCLELRPTSLSH